MNSSTNQENRSSGTQKQLVCFILAGHEYGFPISQVAKVLRLEDRHMLPAGATVFDGVIEVDKEMVPLIDLRKRFGHIAGGDMEKVLLVKTGGNESAGVIVDDITDIESITENEIMEFSGDVSGGGDSCVAGVARLEGRSITVLDARELLAKHEKDSM